MTGPERVALDDPRFRDAGIEIDPQPVGGLEQAEWLAGYVVETWHKRDMGGASLVTELRRLLRVAESLAPQTIDEADAVDLRSVLGAGRPGIKGTGKDELSRWTIYHYRLAVRRYLAWRLGAGEAARRVPAGGRFGTRPIRPLDLLAARELRFLFQECRDNLERMALLSPVLLGLPRRLVVAARMKQFSMRDGLVECRPWPGRGNRLYPVAMRRMFAQWFLQRRDMGPDAPWIPSRRHELEPMSDGQYSAVLRQITDRARCKLAGNPELRSRVLPRHHAELPPLRAGTLLMTYRVNLARRVLRERRSDAYVAYAMGTSDYDQVERVMDAARAAQRLGLPAVSFDCDFEAPDGEGVDATCRTCWRPVELRPGRDTWCPECGDLVEASSLTAEEETRATLHRSIERFIDMLASDGRAGVTPEQVQRVAHGVLEARGNHGA